jgi:photosystem II stability/assembly factor-like uncharacterized protein
MKLNFRIKIFAISLLVINFFPTFSQQKIELLSETKGLSIRGLSVVSDKIFWVSGNKGTVGKSIDGGLTFEWTVVKGFEKSDFRDIEASDENTAIIMAISEPAYILKTIDGGKNWKTVYENYTKGMFLDALDFGTSRKGIVVGDAVGGKIFLAKTEDSGDSWQEIEPKPASIGDEGCFASSGTNIVLDKNNYYFVTGGLNSRFFKNGIPSQIPIIQGLETTGANSIAISKNGKNIIIVGGDFNKKDSQTDNCIISKNGGKTFQKSTANPIGYRSCVEYISKKTAISCGLNGVDISKDNGDNWLNISNESFHSCQKANNGKVVYFAGGNGKIGKLLTK